MLKFQKRYLMEDARESGRLAAKVDPGDYVKRYLAPYIKINKNSKRRLRLLDVGCGAGNITTQIAKLFPSIDVVGIDLNGARFFQEKKKTSAVKNLNFLEMDAEKLTEKSLGFDFVHCRFLLEYMKSPERVINSFARILRKDGVLILQDLDGQLLSNYPVSKRFQGNVNKVIRSLAKKGFDPWVGRKLYSYTVKSGLKPLDVRLEPYHLFPGKIDSFNYALWRKKLSIAEPLIITALKSKKAAKSFTDEYLRYLKNEKTLSFSVVFTVAAVKAA